MWSECDCIWWRIISKNVNIYIYTDRSLCDYIWLKTNKIRIEIDSDTKKNKKKHTAASEYDLLLSTAQSHQNCFVLSRLLWRSPRRKATPLISGRVQQVKKGVDATRWNHVSSEKQIPRSMKYWLVFWDFPIGWLESPIIYIYIYICHIG